MSALEPDDNVTFTGAELRDLLEDAFAAGVYHEAAAVWGDPGTDFDTWFDRLEWEDTDEPG